MKKKICIIVANYYPNISKDLLKGAIKVLKKNNIQKAEKKIAPGVFEIPFIISKYINSYDGFIAIGCVIQGETPHFNFISKAAINGIMQLSIINKKPIGNAIITCLNKDQAIIRSSPSKKDKAGEAAKAMLSLLKV